MITLSACVLIHTDIEKKDLMTTNLLKPELQGIRNGYEIRFTCPNCHTDNAIVNKSPRDHYKTSRDATCKRCKKRSTIITPGPDYR